ncbi:MAG: nucleotidyltransferase family protein [Chloroflexi bacterium]|nr:nucleotidyltransferase family protein [Chloroflexota bacterium]
MANKRIASGSLSLDDILNTLRDHLPELRERYGVTSMGVFGSYVRGRERKRSDLDVLVEFQQAPSMFRFIELQEYLSELLGVKVDLVNQRALKPGIGQRILAEVVPV